jgi:RNA polymerase sigma-70 factor (ECF subfamily)
MAHVAEITRLAGEAISLLPRQRQQIYRLSREAGLKPAAIAEQLSLSVHTVKNALVSALKQIREYLEMAGHFLPVWWLCVHFL